MKIALTIISKDKEDAIVRALESTQGVFDLYILQDTGSTDKTVENFRKWCKKNKKEYKTSKKFVGKDYRAVEVNGKKILGEFNAPRNDSFKMAREAGVDMVMWIDSDDILVNPQHVHQHAERMNKEDVGAEVMTYVYAKAKDNLKPVVQKRERLIDIRKKGEWVNWVHETYNFLEPVKIAETNDIWVEHERTGADVLETGRRNKLIMHSQLKELGLKSFSDQMLNNLSFDHWEHKEFPEAIKYYKKLLARGTVKGELLFQINIKMARAYLGLSKQGEAIVHANEASKINGGLADPYLILAEIYTDQRKWLDAIHYAKKVLKIGKPNTPAPINEYEYYSIPRRIMINAYLHLGELEEAKKLADELEKLEGSDQARRDRFMLEGEISTKKAILGISHLLQYLQSTNQVQYADRLREAIPFTLLDHHIVRNLIHEMGADQKRKSRKVKFEGSKSIVIYSGEGAIEQWDGESDVTRGIGGSEGMCIQLSRELAKLGNKVVVYNDCGESSGKTFDGVLYEDHRKWNPDMKCDVFISLRRPDVFNRVLGATKQYLWLHDTEYGKLPSSFFYSPNNVFVLSEAHKSVIKDKHGITEDTIFWKTRNGLNPISMKYADDNAGKRNPFQIIYASSYDRGLDNVLTMWPKIKEAVPQAELKIFYGWNTFDSLMKGRQGTKHGEWMKNYKSRMVKMIAESEGVQELGRVSQNELYKHFAESGVWAYFTEFYEISCINAMSSQALGCIPVCTPHAALNETVSSKYGMKVEMSGIADALIYLLKNPKEAEKRREPMSKWARKAYDMKELAISWNEKFNG